MARAEDIETWLAEYIAANGEGDPREAGLDANYFELELLDSLGLVMMVGELEARYGLTLEPEHFQDPRFCSVRGLAAIVDEAAPR
jgi:acyl carrier protein